MKYIIYAYVMCSDSTIIEKHDIYNTYDDAVYEMTRWQTNYWIDQCRVTTKIDTVIENDLRLAYVEPEEWPNFNE